MKNLQITPKYRFKMMRKDKIKSYCMIAIKEACKRHHIEIIILKVLPDHLHLMVDIPRGMSDARLVQIVKGLSSYILFRLCPQLRRRYPKGHFWSAGYFCESVGTKDFESVYEYIEKQEARHGFLVGLMGFTKSRGRPAL